VILARFFGAGAVLEIAGLLQLTEVPAELPAEVRDMLSRLYRPQRANAALSSNLLRSFSTCSRSGWATPRFCHRPPRIDLEKRLAFPGDHAILPLR
jgi:hypothetical protein